MEKGKKGIKINKVALPIIQVRQLELGIFGIVFLFGNRLTVYSGIRLVDF